GPETHWAGAYVGPPLPKNDSGTASKDISWVQGGLKPPGRRDKFPLNLPQGFPLTAAGDASLSQLLAQGQLDAVISARQPSCFLAGHPMVRRLFPDYRAAEQDYYRRTGVFPIMHAVGIRPDILDRHPWLAASVSKAFVAAKRLADAEFAETTALKIGLPWVTAEFDATTALMGRDFWSYGIEPNRKTLELMVRYSYEQ